MRRARLLSVTLLFAVAAGSVRPGAASDFTLSQAVQGLRPTQVLAYLDVRDAEGRPVAALDAASSLDQPDHPRDLRVDDDPA